MGSRAERIKVCVVLRSGTIDEFEITEAILDHLEALRAGGLDGWDLCAAWLGPAMSPDQPVRVHVSGYRRSGLPIALEFQCGRGSQVHRTDGAAESDTHQPS